MNAQQWGYCPECGCEEVRHEEGEHKQCAQCHQEWWSDIDYSEEVRTHLAGRYRDKDEIIRRLEQQLAVSVALSAPPAMDERAAFEAWVITRKVCTHKGGHLKKDSAGNYLDYRINDRWLTWQARAVHDQRPVVTLPEYSDQRGGHFYQGWNELLSSLAEQIGVKLTPKIRPYAKRAETKA